MVMTKSELIGSLKHEARILVHLAGKIDRGALDYRPTPKQRSTLELLRYLTIMGPQLVTAAKAGFDTNKWNQAAAEANARDFDQTLDVLRGQADLYASLLTDWTEEDFRAEIEMFGNKYSRGAFLVNLVLCGHAAYRTQLFCYLKSCGREELSTMNLWAGMDAPAA
jgi:hypothetical protein